MALVATTGCEPKMTITAKMEERGIRPAFNAHVVGTITPAKATKTVVLQRTQGGKWVDWKQYPDGFIDKGLQLITAPVNQTTGAYRLTFYVDTAGPLHLRVRSAGGAVSPGFYVTPAFT